MSDIVIIGGGFAGVWSAAAAARVRETAARVRDDADLRITLVAPNDALVLRPRMYEPKPARATVPLDRILPVIGVEHLKTAVTGIDTEKHQVSANGSTLTYDRLILAAGSRLVRPGIPGAGHLFTVDTVQDAQRLDDHLRDGFTAVVVGAGFAGLEVATELAARGRVILVERANVIGPDLGPGPRPPIESALDELGIERRLDTTVTSVDRTGAHLSDGTYLAADAVIWTAGLEASPLTADIPAPRDTLGRLAVDHHLRVNPTGAPHTTDPSRPSSATPRRTAGAASDALDVFAAGDTAAARFDADHLVTQSCQHAVPLGKVAGHNAAADLLGLSPREFAPGPYVTCLDLGAAGAVLTRGWDREVVASGPEAKRTKKWIMDIIHPPTDDPGLLLMNSDRVWEHIPT